MAELTTDEWEQRYKPLDGPSGSLVWEYDEIPEDMPPNRVWTLVDGDTRTWVLAGYHFVNRFGYAITEVPWTDPETHAPWDHGYIGEDDEIHDDE